MNVCVCTLLKPIPWVTKDNTYMTTHAVLPTSKVDQLPQLATDEYRDQASTLC